jgi:hypothetical protein
MARMAAAERLPDLATSKGFIFKGFTFERIALVRAVHYGARFGSLAPRLGSPCDNTVRCC